MSTYTIPLAAVPSQTLTVRLGDQDCRIDLKQLSTGLYLSLYVSGAPVVQGVLCLSLVRLVRGSFTGDLYFYDTQGTDDPDYTGLAGRWVLVWDDAL